MKQERFIPGGSFLVARNIYASVIWKKPPQYLKLFLWLIGNAAFESGHNYKGHTLNRGQLITTYSEIADALAYQFNRAINSPTQKEIRMILAWLQLENMILVQPAISGTSPNKGRPSILTRAYVGLLISIINYDTYQDSKSYKGRDKGRPSDELGQLAKECVNNDKNPAEISSQIFVLQERYSDQEIINQVFQAIASTRKSNRIVDSVKLSILNQWNKYPAPQVIDGMRTYLEKGYAAQGKNEKYLLGIIKNSKVELPVEPGKKVRPSAGNKTLDDHYRSQGWEIRP